MTVLDRIAQLDKLFVQQKFTPLVNKYEISTVAEDGRSAGEPLLHVQQKRMKIREEINFFADEAQSQHVLRIKKRNIMEFRGRADVMLADGTVIGQLQKVFGKSLLRSSWQILDADGNEVATAEESNMGIAILRRIWGFIPIVENIPFFIPFHFDINIGGRQVGRYTRIWAIRDRYVMDVTGDTERAIDRRVLAAFTIALDALQDR